MSMHAPRGAPFPGLEPFRSGDAAYFFGRAVECGIVVDNLLAYPVSVLHGPSGSGKSSLLGAGVVPLLAREQAARAAPIVCTHWSGGPRAALCDALRAAHGAAAPPGEAGLGALLTTAAGRAPGRLLILLDQFEELFAAGVDEGELADVIAEASAVGHVTIAIRDDALARLDRLADTVPGLFDRLVPLGHLDLAAGREAIEQPVAAWNAATGDAVRIEPELTAAVVAEVRNADAASINAPYLQLVMRRLWDAELTPQRRVLDGGALARQGGAEAIVAAHVDRAMTACSNGEQAVAAAMLDVLVTPSGAKVPQRGADLAAYARVPEARAAAVLDLLAGEERLLQQLGDGRYQLAHDALAAPVLDWRERWRRRERRRRERRRLLSIMVFVAVLLTFVTLIHGLDPLELATVDARFALRGARPAPRDVLLVKIDDASLAKLGEDWPVPRRVAGDAIDWIGEGRPRVIAYDVDFSGRRPGDRSLAEAIYGARRRVVLAADATAPGGRVQVLGGNDVLTAIGAQPGYSAFDPGVGGVIRHPLYAVDGVKSFAVAAAEAATGRAVGEKGVDDAWLDYYGPEGTLRSVPFWKVVRHEVPRSAFQDKIVVVGVTSPAIDRHPVWGLHEADMAGVEIQATAIDTVRRGLPLRSLWPAMTVTLVAAFALLPVLLSARRSLALTLTAALALGTLYLALAVLAFAHGLVLPVVAPIAALLLAAFAVLLVRVVHGSEQAPEVLRR